MKEKIKQYILDTFMHGDGSFEDDEYLHESGIINSMGYAKLLAFIEETYDVSLDMGELSADNFGTLNDIVEMIKNKMENK